jgi:hypothetical protein
MKREKEDHILPLEVVPMDDGKWGIVTRYKNPVGPRLLKGVALPNITHWGRLKSEEDANRMKQRLTEHITTYIRKRK